MEERNTENRQAELEAYARQLAAAAARVPGMTEQQREHNAEKIEELRRRVEALPQELYEVYARELHALGGADPELEPPAPAQDYDDAYEGDSDEFEDDDEYEYDRHGNRRKRRKSHGCLIAFLIVLLVPALLLGAGWLWVKAEIDGSRGEPVTQSVAIRKGSSSLAIGQQLEEAGIIRSAQVFRIYVRLKADDIGELQYGTFDLTSDMSYDELIHILEEATEYRKTQRVTFPEGKTAVQYAQIMEEAGLCTAQEFLDAANKEEFSQFRFWALREEDPNQFMRAEGYLFPDTYEFFVGDNAYNMVAKLYGEFDKKITDEMYARMEELDMTLSEVITLASLVQEEAGNEYSKQVSAVFHNRLAAEMTLGSNVAWNKEKADDNNYLYDTLAGPYGFGSWNAIPLEMREAYDTYDHLGLPAGPVSNPGLQAIEAALWPDEECDDLFFQTDTLGNYYFAKTNAEHEKITADLEAQGIRP